MKYMRLIFSSPILMIALAIVLVLGATTYYFYRQSQVNGGTEQAVAETASLVKAVGKLMVLPENETPTVATVSDPSALADQEFFVGAKAGDKVLIYTGAKKAILYDPRAKKIVNVAPVNIGANAAGTTPAQ